MGGGRRFRWRRLKAQLAEIRHRGPVFVEDLWVLRADGAGSPPPLPAGDGWECLRLPGGPAVAALAARGYDFGGLAGDLIRGARDWADCFLAFHHRRLAHASQVSACRDNPNVYGPLQAEIDSGAVMVGPCLTLPAFRGQGLYPQVLGWIAAAMADDGKGPVLIAVRRENRASLHGVLKAGYRPWRVYRRRRLGLVERFSARPWPENEV